MTDWRLPQQRREAFLRFYDYHLRHRSHPGMVYSWLPAIADHLNADDDQLAWIVWLNGNTQNPVTTWLLLEVAPRPEDYRKALELWGERFKDLQWDTDRRHQKSKFGVATEEWWRDYGSVGATHLWTVHGDNGWDYTWHYAINHPFMGRLSAWSMVEYARILFGPVVPDAPSMLLGDKSGSRSHRNGLALVDGHDSVYWRADETPAALYTDLELLADELLLEARLRRLEDGPELAAAEDVSRLSLESALCTYKGWHKPNRRYPNVYADMAYDRLLWAEQRWGQRFEPLWAARERDLPEHLRLEDNPYDPGCVPVKQNHYLNTGQPIMMDRLYTDMPSDFREAVDAGRFGVRKDWDEQRWT